MNTNDPKAPYTVKLHGPIEAATAPLLPTEENLGFKFDLNDPHVDISSASSELASSFALWFGDDVRNWHPEEIADAALRFGIASGELMVVITTKIEEVHTSDGIFFECVACGVDYPSSDALKPGEFCRCGAKIIEG